MNQIQKLLEKRKKGLKPLDLEITNLRLKVEYEKEMVIALRRMRWTIESLQNIAMLQEFIKSEDQSQLESALENIQKCIKF